MAETYPPKFEEFWKAYPRKVAKPNALKAWSKAGIEDDMYMAQAAIDDVKKRTRMRWWNKDKSKVPHPTTWINAQRWHDEGWEDEIERDEKPNTGRYVRPPQEPEPKLPWEESLIARVFRVYLLTAGGLPSVKLALKIKAELMRDYVPGYRESIAAEEVTPNEVCAELADLFVRRMDAAYGLEIADRVLTAARRKAA